MSPPRDRTRPQDADGDAFRRLEADGFDFEPIHEIDFNIDFETWPPARELLNLLAMQYPNIRAIEPSDDGPGYVQFAVEAKLTYELVLFIQASISELVAPFGGVCESWGVMQE